jgi:hypothetical protein
MGTGFLSLGVMGRGVKLNTQPLQILGSWFWALFPTYVQGVYKRMLRFQKLTITLFLPLHGQNVHRQQRQLSKFFMH